MAQIVTYQEAILDCCGAYHPQVQELMESLQRPSCDFLPGKGSESQESKCKQIFEAAMAHPEWGWCKLRPGEKKDSNCAKRKAARM